MLFLAQVIGGLALIAYNVNQQTIRQAIIPDRLMGRVQAATLVVVWAEQVVGSLLGGTVGQWAGLRAALVLGASSPFSAWCRRWQRRCVH